MFSEWILTSTGFSHMDYNFGNPALQGLTHVIDTCLFQAGYLFTQLIPDL